MRKALTIACIAAIAVAGYDDEAMLGQTNVSMHLAQLEAGSPRSIPAELAQATKVTKSTNCLRAPNRARKPLPDFWSILAAGKEWTDTEFPATNDAFYWKGQGEPDEVGAGTRPWGRAFGWKANACLFGKDASGPDDLDIIQGVTIGNCWFMSATSTFAGKQDRALKLFVNPQNTLPAAGIHAFNVYSLGVPATIVVDDKLPLTDDKEWLYFAHQSKDGSMWVPLLEKAFAKYWGNYSHIVGGQSTNAARFLQGGPSKVITILGSKADDVWNTMLKATENGDIMGMGLDSTWSGVQNAYGLWYDHAYSVHGVIQLDDGTKLVRVQDPLLKEFYNGPWSDTDKRWTDALRAEVNKKFGEAQPYVQDKTDNAWWMPFTDTKANYGGFMGQVEEVYLTYDVTGWHSDYFLRLDDDGTGTADSFEGYEGSRQHSLEIYSEVAQTVHIQANHWHWRAYPPACLTQFDKEIEASTRNYSVLAYGNWWEDDYQYKEMDTGGVDLEPFVMKAGQKLTVKFEVDLRHPNGVTSTDWSVVAWAKDGAVRVTHKSGTLSSNHWPVLKDDHEYEDEDEYEEEETDDWSMREKDFANWIESSVALNSEEGQSFDLLERLIDDRYEIQLRNGGPDYDTVWGIVMNDYEWHMIEHWYVDPATGHSTRNAFFDWDLEEETDDLAKACEEVGYGQTKCWISTPVGVNAGWIGMKHGEGYWEAEHEFL